jgi:hypothetical protein
MVYEKQQAMEQSKFNKPSLFIPRVFNTVSEAHIRKTFEALQLGVIHHIDIRKCDAKFNRVFIHYKRWFSEGNAVIARERMNSGKDVKVIYEEPWFWKVSLFRSNKTL